MSKGRATHYRAVALTEELANLIDQPVRTETDFNEPGYYLVVDFDRLSEPLSVGKKVGLGEHCRRLAFAVELLERTKGE